MNLDKLDAAIAYIEAHPGEHDQMTWLEARCGTTACLAGHVALLNGGVPAESGLVLVNGRRVHVSDYANEVLDLSHDQHERLFYAGDLEEIRDVRNLIAAGDL